MGCGEQQCRVRRQRAVAHPPCPRKNRTYLRPHGPSCALILAEWVCVVRGGLLAEWVCVCVVAAAGPRQLPALRQDGVARPHAGGTGQRFPGAQAVGGGDLPAGRGGGWWAPDVAALLAALRMCAAPTTAADPSSFPHPPPTHCPLLHAQPPPSPPPHTHNALCSVCCPPTRLSWSSACPRRLQGTPASPGPSLWAATGR